MDDGSGLKQLATREDQYVDMNVVESTSRSATNPNGCKASQEAANNWDLAKKMGVSFCNQEDIMISKLASLDERDKGEAQKMGRSAGIL